MPARSAPRPSALHDAAGRPFSSLPPSLPEHIRQELEREIIERRLLQGERITETHLATRLGVSRTPVREAMAALEGQGLIVRMRGRGTHVAAATSPEEAEALFRSRVPLESFLTAAAAPTFSHENIETLRRLQREFKRELRQELARGDGTVRLERLVTLDSDFHWTIYNASGSGLVSVVASYWGRHLRELYDAVYEREHPSRFCEQHEEIIAALERRDPEAARATMAEHIETGLFAIRASVRATTGQADQAARSRR